MNKKPIKKKKVFNLLKKIKKINLGKEKKLLEDSIGRYLDEDLFSKINLPPFNNSAVDGYALHKDDIILRNHKLICNQRIAAGDHKSITLNKGEAIKIFTGAKMPLCSKTVVMQENVKVQDREIKILKMPLFGENYRILGEDVARGRKIFSNGDKITSSNINLIAAIGKKNVFVKKKINVGFFTSGNELINPTENLKGSQINNSNYYSLKALLDKPFVKHNYLGILKDSENGITKSFMKNINKYNIILTTGGASVGEEDHLIKIIDKLGKIYFWKTAIKPGRPLAIGKIKNTIVVCLPGNPVSVHLLYGMIIGPFLNYLCTGKLILPESTMVKTNFSMRKKNKRLEWLRVIVKRKNQDLIVSKYPKQGSGMISSIVFADGIIEIPEEVRLIEKNDYFNFYSFKYLFD